MKDKAADTRLARLAKTIDALADKDDLASRRVREIADLRRRAAVQLYTLCAEFVNDLNGLLSATEVRLDPSGFGPDQFQDPGSNLIQINVRGRLLQFEFRATPELFSTEDFRIPYILEGSVRAFNQELLDKDLIEEQLIFHTLEKQRNLWRYFDARTYHSGELDRDYLITVIYQLL